MLCLSAAPAFLRPGAMRSRTRAIATMLTLEPIGHIASCWPEKFGTPRQGSVVPSSTAELVLAPGALDGAASADGLAAFSHVARVARPPQRGQRAVGQGAGAAPPRRPRRVFATRSPFRPNPLGLSLAKLERVDGARLELSGVDLVDGTPILDVKPYIPAYDAPAEEARVADWVDPPPIDVVVSDGARADLQRLRGDGAAALERTLVQTFAADPRPLYRWRRQRDAESAATYEVRVGGVRATAEFDAAGQRAELLRVVGGE